jgi:PAS domain-containing protein
LSPDWVSSPYDALTLNVAFCVLAGIFIAIIHFQRKLSTTLLEKQQDLDRAQAIGKIGNWRMNVQRNELHWSDENHRIFGIPKGTPLTYEVFLAAAHPKDREYVDIHWQAALRGEPYDIEHRIIVQE